MGKTPDGWDEPISEGLWQYDLPFGAPRWMAYVHIVLFVLTLMHHFRWCYAMAIGQAVCVGLTQLDPEWPQIIHDWFHEPGEIEP